jgi:Mce-associated membrane protein
VRTSQFGGANDTAHPAENSPNGVMKEVHTVTDHVDEYADAPASDAPDAEEWTPAQGFTADPGCSTDDAGSSEGSEESEADGPVKTKRRINWMRALSYGVLPGLVLLAGLAAAFLKWQDSTIRDGDIARIESAQAAKDSTIALLSYKPDTVDKDLRGARSRLTGDFKDAYTSLTNDVVIPGAKQKQISAVATVPAVASISADPTHAIALVFVNQTVITGNDAPTDTASAVKVTLDKINGHWLISKFDPI